MTEFSDEFFKAAFASLEDRLLDLITQPKSDKDPPDKWSKSMSALMKAKADLLAQQEAEQAKAFSKQHTRYEDMPPPTPEDEARFHDEFRTIMRDILKARRSG